VIKLGIETFIVLDWKDKFAGKIMKVERKYFHDYSLKSISYFHLKEVIKTYNIIPYPNKENRYHLLKLYIENCKEKIAREHLKRFMN